MGNRYINFGCGTHCPSEFINYDGSFNLYMQRLPLIGTLVKNAVSVKFPSNAQYGDIVKGLPMEAGSADGLYSSHVLEHLPLEDLRKALRNCHRYLKPGGLFRSVLPNLEDCLRTYRDERAAGDPMAAHHFMQYTFLGYEMRPKGFVDLLKWHFSGYHHFWMWDYEAMEKELYDAGFSKVSRSGFNQSADPYFKHVEVAGRFDFNALCFEAVK